MNPVLHSRRIVLKIRGMEIKGFRCLQDIKVEFDDKLNLIIGENDTGKSSLVACIRAVTQGLSVEPTDFSFGKTEMKIIVILDDLKFEKSHSLENGEVDGKPLIARPNADYLSRTKAWLDASERNFENNDELEKLKYTAHLFGIRVQSNSRTETLVTSLKALIDQGEADPDFAITNAKFPEFNSIQMDGKQFENVSGFFTEAFLKARQSSLWEEAANETQTIKEIVKSAIDGYTKDIASQLDESGIMEKIKIFLPTLTDIKIIPNYSQQDFNLTADVKFLENGGEIDLKKKGDGTKRRITMALLELKKDAKLVETDTTTIYLLDEPDTHLHVRAQMQLFDTLEQFSQQGHQIIIATHSPFIINAVKPQNILMLCQASQNYTNVKSLRLGADETRQTLKALGIENTFLYFARNIVLVEGETEEKFVHSFFRKITGKDPSASLIKIIDVNGIHNIHGFCQAIIKIHNLSCIHVIHDQEMDEDTSELINKLGIPPENRYISGTQEFEDAFEPQVLYNAWNGYLVDNGRTSPETWTPENISTRKKGCLADDTRKFSKELKSLSAGSGKKMSKPIFGTVLGEHIEEADLPESLCRLFRNLENA